MDRILLIDDDPDIRTILNIFLKKQGFEVETASSKMEAFQKLEQFKPAVVLLDVLLSGADGRAICKNIKENPHTSQIPVIMFSAHPGAADRISEYGADDFIAKPLNTELLLSKVRHYLNKAHQ